MLRTVEGVEVNISGRTFSSRSFCHQPSALALSKKCPALTISYRPKLICKKRHGLDIHYSAAERSLGSHRRRRLRASSFPMPLTSNTQDSTRFPPHITALMRAWRGIHNAGYGRRFFSGFLSYGWWFRLFRRVIGELSNQSPTESFEVFFKETEPRLRDALSATLGSELGLVAPASPTSY